MLLLNIVTSDTHHKKTQETLVSYCSLLTWLYTTSNYCVEHFPVQLVFGITIYTHLPGQALDLSTSPETKSANSVRVQNMLGFLFRLLCNAGEECSASVTTHLIVSQGLLRAPWRSMYSFLAFNSLCELAVMVKREPGQFAAASNKDSRSGLVSRTAELR